VLCSYTHSIAAEATSEDVGFAVGDPVRVAQIVRLPPYDARPLHQPHQLLHHLRHRRPELRLRLQAKMHGHLSPPLKLFYDRSTCCCWTIDWTRSVVTNNDCCFNSNRELVMRCDAIRCKNKLGFNKGGRRDGLYAAPKIIKNVPGRRSRLCRRNGRGTWQGTAHPVPDQPSWRVDRCRGAAGLPI